MIPLAVACKLRNAVDDIAAQQRMFDAEVGS